MTKGIHAAENTRHLRAAECTRHLRGLNSSWAALLRCGQLAHWQCLTNSLESLQ